jgi:type I restriction enzyme S subunit
VRIGDIAKTTSGGTPSRKKTEYFGGTISWVKSGELNDSAAISHSEETITKLGLDKSSAKLFPAGTLLIALYGATAGKVGILARPAATNQAVCAIFPSEGAQEDFLFYALMHRRVELLSERYGGAQSNLSQRVLRVFPIPLPPLPEQRRIAGALRAIQEAIATQEDVIAAARELKRSLMERIFTYGPGAEPAPTKETKFGEVPEHWQVDTLEKHADIQTGAAKGRDLSDSEVIEVPYLRVANVQDGYLDLSEIKRIRIRKSEVDRYSLHPGDVVLTEGGDFDKLGRGFIWRNQVPNCIHQNHIFAVRADLQALLPEYLAYLVQSDYGKSYFISVAHRTTNLACINKTKLSAFPVLIPNKEEQKQIASTLQTIDAKIAAEEQRKAALEEVFRSALEQLMTGQIRLNAESQRRRDAENS